MITIKWSTLTFRLQIVQENQTTRTSEHYMSRIKLPVPNLPQLRSCTVRLKNPIKREDQRKQQSVCVQRIQITIVTSTKVIKEHHWWQQKPTELESVLRYTESQYINNTPSFYFMVLLSFTTI